MIQPKRFALVLVLAVSSVAAPFAHLRAEKTVVPEKKSPSAPSAAGSLDFSVKLENRFALPTDGHAHVLVRLKGRGSSDGASKKVTRPVNLALIIDRSGSMRGQKIEDARAAASKMIDNLRDGDRAAIVSYASDVRVDVPNTVISPGSSQSGMPRAAFFACVAKCP